jgi:hypothetical protein
MSIGLGVDGFGDEPLFDFPLQSQFVGMGGPLGHPAADIWFALLGGQK